MINSFNHVLYINTLHTLHNLFLVLFFSPLLNPLSMLGNTVMTIR